jgi:hypothetical protein
MKRMALICLWLVAGPVLANNAPVVTNVLAAQQPHTAIFDLTYDIADADEDNVHVSLWYSIDGGTSWDQQCVTISGDVGPGINPGIVLNATWNAGVDFPGIVNTQFSIRIFADDGTGSNPAVLSTGR